MYGLTLNVHVQYPGAPFLVWCRRIQLLTQNIKATQVYLHVSDLRTADISNVRLSYVGYIKRIITCTAYGKVLQLGYRLRTAGHAINVSIHL